MGTKLESIAQQKYKYPGQAKPQMEWWEYGGFVSFINKDTRNILIYTTNMDKYFRREAPGGFPAEDHRYNIKRFEVSCSELENFRDMWLNLHEDNS